MQRARLKPHGHRVRLITFAAALLAVLQTIEIVPASAATAERIRETGKLTLGYRAHGRPFSYHLRQRGRLCRSAVQRHRRKAQIGTRRSRLGRGVGTCNGRGSIRSHSERQGRSALRGCGNSVEPKGCRFFRPNFPWWNWSASSRGRSDRIEGSACWPTAIWASVAW